MEKKRSYELNCGQPIFHIDGVPVGPLLNAVALAYDDSDELIVLHKHGSPERVSAWVKDAQDKLRNGGKIGQEMARDLKYIEIEVPMPPAIFPVDLLNEAIDGNRRALAELIAREGAIDVHAVEVSSHADADQYVRDLARPKFF